MPRNSEDLADCISKILKDYPRDFIIDDLLSTDQIRIRRRGPADYKQEDVVGLYLDSDFGAGKITETTIRNDIQKWLQAHSKKI
ncbi:MAG: hypothetical protein ABL958_10435 [Bdellovibrionia bacterium]